MSIYLADTAAQNALSLSGYAPIYQAAASAYGFPANVLAAQGFVESSYNPSAISNTGAQGIAQFEPATAQQYGVNVNSPSSSIYGQAQYDANLLAQNGGNLNAALQSYSGNTPGYATHVLSVANGANTNTSPYQQIINNSTGAFSVIPQGAPIPSGYSALGTTKTSFNNAINTQALNANQCSFTNWGGCWAAFKMDSLTIFLVIVALLLVMFGVYKMVTGTSGNSTHIIPVPV